jgi:hypothetical protein
MIAASITPREIRDFALRAARDVPARFRCATTVDCPAIVSPLQCRQPVAKVPPWASAKTRPNGLSLPSEVVLLPSARNTKGCDAGVIRFELLSVDFIPHDRNDRLRFELRLANQQVSSSHRRFPVCGKSRYFGRLARDCVVSQTRQRSGITLKIRRPPPHPGGRPSQCLSEE